MAGDNDAGGLLTYLATGSRFGLGFFIPLLCGMTLVTLVVQEAAARIALATGESLPDLMRSAIGRGWTRLLAAELAIQNWFTVLSEFAGMGIGLQYFGVPLQVGIPISAAAVLLFLRAGSYRSAERIAITLAVLNLALVPLGIWALRTGIAHPSPASLRSPMLVFFAVAMVGNALAPWMPFFQAEAVRERRLAPGDLPAVRADIALGGAMQAAVACAVLILAALVHLPGRSAAGLLQGIGGHTGPIIPALLAIGLVDAGLVAALTVSLTTAWTVAETWAGPRKDRLNDPLVRRIYLICLGTAALVAWIPSAPLTLFAVGAQVVAALLMPPLLLALLQLLNLRKLGPLRNSATGNVLMGLAIVIFTGAAVAMCIYA